MTTVRDLIRSKGGQVWSVGPQATVLEALKTMADRNMGAVLVMQGDEVLGILSERDCVRKLDLEGRTAQETRVEQIMTRRVLYVEAGQSVDECMALMNEKNIRHLPVFDDGRLVGLLSIRDVLREVIAHQEFMIAQLEHYITGSKQ